MTSLWFRAVLGACALGLVSMTAAAAPADYEFQPVTPVLKGGPATELSVRLIHKPTGKPVDGAVLFRTALDMGPDDMAAMTAKVEAVPSKDPGVYRFKADLTMGGRWALRLMAKVPGEKDTVEGTVIFAAGN